jgi:hypothetical protein
MDKGCKRLGERPMKILSKLLLLLLLLFLCGAIALLFPSKPKTSLSVAVRKVYLTKASNNCVVGISNKTGCPVLYDCAEPISGHPQIMLAFTTNKLWEEKLEWGSPFACFSQMVPHESKSFALDIELPTGTRRFKVGTMDARLTWRGRLAEYIEDHFSDRFLSSLAFDLKYEDFERNMVTDWSQECSITNNSVVWNAAIGSK